MRHSTEKIYITFVILKFTWFLTKIIDYILITLILEATIHFIQSRIQSCVSFLYQGN